ncbi:MAG: hypothetical protein ACRCS6_01785 [Turicibacter sp.]
MRRKLLGCLLLIFSLVLCACQNVELDPKETADAFLTSWFNIDFLEMNPRYEAYTTYLEDIIPEQALTIGDEPSQKFKELHGELLSFITDEAYESAINKNLLTHPLVKSMTLKADSTLTNMDYEELYKDEESVGYGVTVNFELTPINGDPSLQAIDYITLNMKKIDNSWKVIGLTVKKIKPL